MKFLPLLGKRLKDDEVVDILECDDVTVIYDFDRSHENIPDVFWASAQKEGYQLRFDERQVLDVIFLYVLPLDGFNAIDLSAIDVPVFASVSQVEAHCAAESLHFVKGQVRGGVLAECDWARIDTDRWSLHYDFRNDGGGFFQLLTLITLSLPRKD
jgi:hypothetical protein